LPKQGGFTIFEPDRVPADQLLEGKVLQFPAEKILPATPKSATGFVG
jgi:hypothetical protein